MADCASPPARPSAAAGPRWLLTSYRRDEIVTPSRNSDDVAVPALAVAESAAQGADLNLRDSLLRRRFSARPGRSVPLCQRPRRRARPEQPGCRRRGCRAAPAGCPRAEAAALQGAETARTRSRVRSWAGRRTHSPRFGHSHQAAVRGHGQSSLAPQISLREVDGLLAMAADHGLQQVKSEALGHPPAIARVALICNGSPCSAPPSLGSIGIARQTRRDSVSCQRCIFTIFACRSLLYALRSGCVSSSGWRYGWPCSTCGSISRSAGKMN